MNVKIASQTLSSSAADALQYLKISGHPSFCDSEGTIRFIRTIDRLFDLLNTRNPFGNGFKTPLKLSNKEVWENTIKSSIEYLLALRCVDGRPLVEHRRKTFIIGFIGSAKSAEKLALDMLENSYSYFLTYKVSQDHLELLFACIRGKNGYNNNPDVRIFKSALKRLMLRNSIVASKNANCAMLEENDFNPIFSLKWSKNRAPLEESNELDENNDTDILPYVTQLSTQSPYQVSILAYNAGFIVRALKRSLDCEFCFRSLGLDSSQVPNYAFDFIILENRGGLVFPLEWCPPNSESC